jgi:hypothetical protein
MEYKELGGPAVTAFRLATAEVKQRWSVIDDQQFIISYSSVLWKVSAAFAVVSTHQPALGPRSYFLSIRKVCAPAVGALYN